MTTNPLLRIARRGAAALVAALALVLAPAPAADARPRHPPAEHVKRHAAQLGLDAAAQAALEEIVAESEAQERALRGEMRAARKQMRALLSGPELDRAAVAAQADALDALHARSHRRRLDTVLRIHELLTPEQRAALVEIRERDRPWKRGRGPLGRCSADLREQCADAPDGAAALRCLADRWDALSEPCREAVARCRGEEPGDAPE
jgi:Spy/CpxP family protein refolding chaperone